MSVGDGAHGARPLCTSAVAGAELPAEEASASCAVRRSSALTRLLRASADGLIGAAGGGGGGGGGGSAGGGGGGGSGGGGAGSVLLHALRSGLAAGPRTSEVAAAGTGEAACGGDGGDIAAEPASIDLGGSTGGDGGVGEAGGAPSVASVPPGSPGKSGRGFRVEPASSDPASDTRALDDRWSVALQLLGWLDRGLPSPQPQKTGPRGLSSSRNESTSAMALA